MTRKIEVTMIGPDADGFLWLRADGGGLAGMVSLRADSIVGRAFLAAPSSRAPEDAETDEAFARLVNGLVEAGDILFGHAQRIDFNPAAANMARESWMESRAALSGDHEPKHYPEDWPAHRRSARERTEGEATAGEPFVDYAAVCCTKCGGAGVLPAKPPAPLPKCDRCGGSGEEPARDDGATKGDD